jgi:hypothetical protein
MADRFPMTLSFEAASVDGPTQLYPPTKTAHRLGCLLSAFLSLLAEPSCIIVGHDDELMHKIEVNRAHGSTYAVFQVSMMGPHAERSKPLISRAGA